jgi:hypothetical protein
VLFSMAGKIHYVLWIASMVMITLASLKLAVRAMNVKGEIEFPEVSPEELFDRSALLPAGVFALLFLVLPAVLFEIAIPSPPPKSAFDSLAPKDGARVKGMPSQDDLDALADYGNPSAYVHEGDADVPPEAEIDPALRDAVAKVERAQKKRAPSAEERAPDAEVSFTRELHDDTKRVGWLLVLAALALFLYAPMALVMFLRTGSTWAFLFVPQGIAAIAQDVRAYAGLAAIAVPAFGLKVGIDRLVEALPFYVEPLLLFPRSALILVAWGACGLYVRQRARDFDMPVDVDDWVAHARPPPTPDPSLGLDAAPVARRRPTAISLDGGPDDFDPPPVVGTLLPPNDKP